MSQPPILSGSLNATGTFSRQPFGIGSQALRVATSVQGSNTTAKHALWFGIAVALSIGSIWWLATAINYVEALAAVKQARVGPLLTAALLVMAVFMIRTERWRLLIADDDGPGRRELLRALMAGFVTNTIAPVRIGELTRILALTASSQRSAPQSITASVIFEKWLDTIILLLIAGIAFVTGLTRAGFSGNLLILFAIAVVIGSLGIAVLRSWRPALPRLNGRLEFISPFVNFLSSTMGAFVRQRHASTPPRYLAIVGYTALAFAAGFAANVLVLSAYRIAPGSLLWLAGLLLLTLYIGGLAPGPPARLGVYHAIVFATLTSQQIAPAPALAIALSMHAITVLLPLVFGLGAMWLPLTTRSSIDKNV